MSAVDSGMSVYDAETGERLGVATETLKNESWDGRRRVWALPSSAPGLWEFWADTPENAEREGYTPKRVYLRFF